MKGIVSILVILLSIVLMVIGLLCLLSEPTGQFNLIRFILIKGVGFVFTVIGFKSIKRIVTL